MAIEIYLHAEVVTPRRLWFGVVGSALSWLTLGFLDLLVVWLACAHDQDFSGNASYPLSRMLSFAVAIILLLNAVAAGTTSYRNWRAISSEQHLLDANATDRREFMALLGVIISLTLGMGIIWLSLPPLLIQLCQRAK